MGYGSGAGVVVDDVTIEKNTSGALQIKEIERNRFLKDISLNELNITTLQLNASLSNVNDDFIEDFADSNGILNTVDTGNTTSIFSTNLYVNDEYVTLVSDNAVVSELQTAYVLKKTISNINDLVQRVKYEILASGGESGYCKIKFYYSDATNDEVEAGGRYSSYSTVGLTNPNPTKTVSYIEVYVRSEWADGISAYVKNVDVDQLITGNTDIYLNYDKINPSKIIMFAFSDTINKSDVGAYTYELIHISTAETTGELNPEVENTISMTNTPDRLIIHQKNTSISKIKKFVLGVWE